ncbi:MAG: cupin domain-containing protein [Spirochaetales bacterium]|nr:cupin domain-containing protein [Spirochaetales bacterium]
MIKHEDSMKTDVRSGMRGGEGDICIQHIVDKADMKHCRLFSKITIPVNGSIGSHTHENETEYYYILQGEGIVGEKDGDKKVIPGDVVITGNGASHSIRNSGSSDLVFAAVIILDD